MPSLDFTTALGRLLASGALRGEYRADPSRTLRRLGMEGADLPRLLVLDPDELDAQAETLLRKRFGEVSRLLPRTFRSLGSRACETFRAYAESHWPRGHGRHLEDALCFARHLERGKDPGLSPAERNWVQFRLGRSRFSMRPVRDSFGTGRNHRAMQVFLRKRNGSSVQVALYLGLERSK